MAGITTRGWCLIALLLVTACAGQGGPARIEEIAFTSGPFEVVGDLRLPEGRGPHPIVVFVHGDGPNSRTAGGTYLPIMERMQRAGYATFAWDKPGTGESTGEIDHSRLVEQRAQIVLDAIAVLKARSGVDPQRIGLWGISQAGYVMPRVLSLSDDVAFLIAVSCPGEPGFKQGAYLVAAQAACAGLTGEDVARVKDLICAASVAQTYDEYVRYKAPLAGYPALETVDELGLKIAVLPEQEWHADDLNGVYYAFDPMDVIERTAVPVLAFFGEKDTQVDPLQGAEAYRAALARAGNPYSRVALIPGVDHNLILSQTGCLDERARRPSREWTHYAPEYLDTLEAWLRDLPR